MLADAAATALLALAALTPVLADLAAAALLALLAPSAVFADDGVDHCCQVAAVARGARSRNQRAQIALGVIHPTALSRLTSALFHGSHTLGYREFAVRVAMKLDIAAVGLCGTYLLVIMPAECRPYCQRLMLLCACTWLATFSWGGRGLATSWPYNPTQSLIHAVGIAVHTRAAEALCALPARAGQPPGVEGSGIVS